MNESSIFSKYGHEFDYEADFTQVLEKAKKNANQESLSTTTHLKPETKKQLNGEKKNKKSWKKSLFSWLKTDKKSKSTQGSGNGTKITKTVRGHFSGPVQGRPVRTSRAPKTSSSGPLTGIFSSTNRVEDYDVPYICLGQLNNSQKLSYGPVYLVT